MKPQLEMLKQMFDIVSAEGGTKEEVYEKLITWIAVDIGLEAQLTSTLSFDVREELSQMFDLELLRSEPNDWFGELLLKTGIKSELVTSTDIDMSRGDLLSAIFPSRVEGNMPIPIYLEQVGTGYILLAANQHFATEVVLFCTEKDMTSYRTALLTSFLYKVPSQILFKENDNLDVSIGSQNWRQSNLWNPVKSSKLKHV